MSPQLFIEKGFLQPSASFFSFRNFWYRYWRNHGTEKKMCNFSASYIFRPIKNIRQLKAKWRLFNGWDTSVKFVVELFNNHFSCQGAVIHHRWKRYFGPFYGTWMKLRKKCAKMKVFMRKKLSVANNVYRYLSLTLAII